MENSTNTKLSTSALAKRLEVPSSQLFGTLKDYGWIRKSDDSWELTTKGEFEGGEYVHSKRYGRYIIWPEELSEHPLLQALEDNRHITATSLGKRVGLNAREVNRILAELGWIKHGFQGWEISDRGEQCGGIQLENESSGTFYVVWPQAIVTNELFTAQLHLTARLFSFQSSESSATSETSLPLKDDLFADENLPAQKSFLSIDGHQHNRKSLLQICHWLYMAGIAHASNRRLPFDGEYYADFYIPAHQIYIESWDDDSGSELKNKLQRKELYRQVNIKVIDVEQKNLGQLDEFLTREFRKRGIRIY
ncbi:MAG: hypothetical protein ACI89U_000213 [Gammaproteobacteria bacterium]|jgi:hypothetical protein